ncbi:MAG: GtrA family protein [Deltaproteobacteria bacterium]|nr:GtrA family protein [Deltaproteobacteria bacterium]
MAPGSESLSWTNRRARFLVMLRSAAAGMAGAALDFLILALLVELGGVVPAIATVVSALVGAVVNFFLNRSWAFRSRGPVWRQGGHYAIATAVWVALCAIVVHVCVGLARIPYLVARLVADVAVFLGWGFPASRWIFRTGS